MPVYEYECRTCHASLSIWFRSFAAAGAEIPVCTACGSKRLKRLLSRPAVLNAGGSTSAVAVLGAASAENPQDLALAMREAARGRDMGGEFSEVAARLEKGEKSKAIEKSLRKRAGQRRGTH